VYRPSASCVPLLLVVTGVFLRVGFLSTDSLWLDEAFSVHLVTQSTVEQLFRGADSLHPPLYYLALKGAVLSFGTGEVAVRALSAGASILNLWLVYVLARRLEVSRWTAVTSVVLLALSPIDIWYAREARMYAMATTATLAVAIALTIEGIVGTCLLAAALTFAVYVDFTTIPAVLVLGVLWWIRGWYASNTSSDALRLTAALILAVCAAYPLWQQVADVVAGLERITLFARVRDLFGISSLGSGTVLGAAVLGLAALAAAVIGIWRALLGNQSMADGWPVFAGVAFAVMNAALVVPRAFSAKQVLVSAWPAVVIVAAWSLTDDRFSQRRGFVRLRSPRTAIVAASLAASIGSLFLHRADWRGVVTYLDAHAAPDARVVLDPEWNRYPYDYYRPRTPPTTGINDGRAWPKGDFWLVAERYGQRPPTSPSEAWFERHGQLVGTTRFSRLDLRHYRVVD